MSTFFMLIIQFIHWQIPYPLETTEVSYVFAPIPLIAYVPLKLESASRWAIHLWTGRDAASVGLPAPRSKPSSVVSSYARTVVDFRSRGPEATSNDHLLFCNGCNHVSTILFLITTLLMFSADHRNSISMRQLPVVTQGI